jgi:hypothetical protein
VTSDLTSEFLGNSAALVFVENGTYVAHFNWDSAFLVDGPEGEAAGDTVDAAIHAPINQAEQRR